MEMLKHLLTEYGKAYEIYDKIVSGQSRNPSVRAKLRDLKFDLNYVVNLYAEENNIDVTEAKQYILSQLSKD